METTRLSRRSSFEVGPNASTIFTQEGLLEEMLPRKCRDCHQESTPDSEMDELGMSFLDDFAKKESRG